MKKLIHIILAAAIICSCNQTANEKTQPPADSDTNTAQSKQALGKGTGGAGAATVALDLDCEYCKPGDRHIATEGSAWLEIDKFRKVYSRKINNIGGTLILRDITNKTTDVKNLVEPWDVLKFHLCYDKGYLFLALDSAGQCVPDSDTSGTYTPTTSSEERLIVSSTDNYIPMTAVGTSQGDVKNHLKNYHVLNSLEVTTLPIEEVNIYSQQFNSTSWLKENYPCEYAYFSKTPVVDFIRSGNRYQYFPLLLWL
ncbi:MAG: hypothetical protein IPJ79_17510 [Bacteroidetes bacterium]|nr:hypothetical protein [Bacteroidota bacterium]